VPRRVPLTSPIRVGIVGLGQIYELAIVPYRGEPDVEIVAICDTDPERLQQRGAEWPAAQRFSSLEEFLTSDMDLVEILVPTPYHAAVAVPVLEAGFHVNLQKPLANDMAEAELILDAAKRGGGVLRVMEDYLFFEPLVRLKEVVESGEIGEVAGVHMKMVGSGLGGWDVAISAWVWQLEQMKAGRGILVFDDGWHKFAVAHWLFGPVARVWAWIGATELGGGYFVDAPTTIVWEHANGVRGVLDITFAPQMYFRSDYYTCDERFEVTGRTGYARVNRVTAMGIQQPSLEVYSDGVVRQHHALADDLPSSFRKSARNMLDHLLGKTPDVSMSAATASEVLRFVLAIYESAKTRTVVEL
jgi:predicted dehydrogenase